MLEIGFSETTFVLPAEASGTARIRIFTPARAAVRGPPDPRHCLGARGPPQRSVVELETGSGIVPVELERDESGAIVYGRMVQPTPSVELFPLGKRCSLRLASLALRYRSSATTTVLSIPSSCSTRVRPSLVCA